GVNVVGYDDDSGLGQIARLTAEVLVQGGIPHTLLPVGKRRLRASEPRFDTNLICVNAQMLPALVEPFGASLFLDRRTIGFWWWEVDRFPPVMSWASYLVDEIWVGSNHVHDAIQATVNVPVFTFPVPISKPRTVPLDRAVLGIPPDRFAFLFSFSFW